MDGIKIENLHKSYQVQEHTLNVLDGISLHIPSAQITVVLGQSGCGKTTLLRVLGGLEDYDSGEISGFGEEKPAFVFQEPRLMPWLNTKKNIGFGLKNIKEKEKELNHIIETVGLTGFADAYPNQLSGGMQQRVSLARALIYKPSLILMDEPFAALDYFIREKMQKELIQVQKKKNCSILFVTHSIDEALLLGHKIIILEIGNIKKEYTIQENSRDLLGNYFLDIKKDIINNLNVHK